ncbi:MAG: arsenite methyltransferase [Coriobacteriia bacterium]|nr:arsenite methyltransferase [Coriobacteriia bacterium]
MDAEKKELLQQVQDRYIEAAKKVTGGSQSSCCSPMDCCAEPTVGFAASDRLGAKLYTQQSSTEIDALPQDALLASLGCGNPTAVAELKAGETVLDLGSGGGIDVLLSAMRVGEHGFAYGLDMTDEMLELARKNAKEAGATNVEFLKGYIEDIPLPDSSVDIVISNCVINLSVDKPAVFKEIARVLKDGGRIGISDIVADNKLSQEERRAKGSYAGCIAGALSFAEYEAGLSTAGFHDIQITPTHEVVSGMSASIIKAYIHKH